MAARGHIDTLLSVAGETSVTARGSGELPLAVRSVVADVAVNGATQVFSVSDSDARMVVDALDDAGWRIVSLTPKRASLEDYFARLLEPGAEDTSVTEGGDAR